MFRHLLIALAICTAGIAPAQTYPEYNEIFVNDFADLMTDSEEDLVRNKLIELRNERGVEFTVATINNLSDFGHLGEIEPFATGLFNQWGLGDQVKNDGLMLLVSRYDRRLRIEVGFGYGEARNDAMAAIIDEVIVPHFRDDNYALGIDRGVDAVIHEVTGTWPGEFNASLTERAWNRVQRFLGWIGDWIAVFYAALAGFGYRLFRKWKRNKPRICPVDGTKMQKLGEANDDAYLKEGEQVEERLKSVDYDVWVCQSCDHRTVEAYKSWFSKYGACRTCQFKTLEGDSTIVTSATTSSTGLKRVDYHCKNCDDRYHTHVTIPRKSESSSSSSSSGGSGGGSSSGGGASGSW